jgi:hypothetical protein
VHKHLLRTEVSTYTGKYKQFDFILFTLVVVNDYGCRWQYYAKLWISIGYCARVVVFAKITEELRRNVTIDPATHWIGSI